VGLALGDQLRLEAASAIARHRDLDLAVFGQDGLRADPIAAVAPATSCGIALLIAEMLGQLRSQRTLDQRLLQPPKQPIIAGQVLRLQLASG
jgi:hypothetical protein